jgi:hypothetical protein
MSSDPQYRVRFRALQPKERSQVDVTHWAPADGTDVEICRDTWSG